MPFLIGMNAIGQVERIDALQTVLGQINFAARFMGLFTMATGIIILANAVAASRHQRITESALLRTLGASGHQIRRILALEYALLGLAAGLVGVTLALGAGFALGIWVFKVDFYVPWLQVLGAIAPSWHWQLSPDCSAAGG